MAVYDYFAKLDLRAGTVIKDSARIPPASAMGRKCAAMLLGL